MFDFGFKRLNEPERTVPIDETNRHLSILDDVVTTLMGVSCQDGKEWWAKNSSPESNAWEFLPPSYRLAYKLEVWKERQRK